jgi:indole-3-glycerol phosphate synthase
VASYLDAIVAAHRAFAANDERDLEELARQAAIAPEPRPFLQALLDKGHADGSVAVIAEIKRRSPMTGDLAPKLDPADLARKYAGGGATCLSVLTDGPHFGGSASDLMSARNAVTLPVLRKDFTVALRDLFDARVMGADAVLLIVAILSDEELVAFGALADELGLSALIEVHDEAELERACSIGAKLIGVNQRDLHTFDVEAERAAKLARLIPNDVVKVAESGIKNRGDIARLVDAGYDAVLIGESLVRSHDPTDALEKLIGGTGRVRKEAR